MQSKPALRVCACTRVRVCKRVRLRHPPQVRSTSRAAVVHARVHAHATGAINWAAVVPRAVPEGIRADRCGFAWDMNGALSNFGQAWGTKGVHRGPGRYIEACDARGAVLPVPCTRS